MVAYPNHHNIAIAGDIDSFCKRNGSLAIYLYAVLGGTDEGCGKVGQAN